MRDYGKVNSSFWISESIRSLSDDGRMLALYLLTSPHANMIGCFRLPDGYVCEDLQWDAKRVSEGFEELSRNGFAIRDKATRWVLIPGYLEWNGFENPNVAIAALKLFRDIPDKATIKPQLADGMRQAISRFETGKLNGFERVLEGFSEGFQTVVGTPEPEPEPEPEPISPGSSPKKFDEPGGSYPTEFELVWQEYPGRTGANPKKSAFKAWNARRREGISPEVMLDGVRRYAVFLRATGKLGSEFVQRASTFFGPDRNFENPWDPPVSTGRLRWDVNQISTPDKTIPPGFRG
ncbi:DNA-binding protein [Salmonella enterica]|nr:DNA-binding protein [Salmonella enterica]ECH5602903.1 DNA-binding protein [Salmonella enterica]EEI2379398.1 DNA-binding protein [Salmonella enterica]